MSTILWRTSWAIGAYDVVVTSPATTTRPVVNSVSTATRLWGSSARRASSTVSLIWSAILSGCPSVTDSEVNSRPGTVCVSWSGGDCVPIMKPGGHFVPNDVSQHGLGTPRHLGGRAVGAEDHGLVVRAAEHRSPADVVDDQQVAALARQLGAGQVENGGAPVAGLGREAHDDRTRVGAAGAELTE